MSDLFQPFSGSGRTEALLRRHCYTDTVDHHQGNCLGDTILVRFAVVYIVSSISQLHCVYSFTIVCRCIHYVCLQRTER